MKYYVTTFYRFIPLNSLEKIKLALESFAAQNEIKGLIIIGSEGINATVAANSDESLTSFKSFALALLNLPEDLLFKDSRSDVAPFRRFKIKIREEIVTLKNPTLIPTAKKNHHLSPSEWNRVLQDEDILLIDTRNWYETKIGTFKGAVNPKTEMFKEFPQFVEDQGFDKDKKILIFCTGGIRCEKGILEMQKQGFENVYQLEGGILNYLEQYPKQQFEGECFVFDHRVAVDQDLKPTQTYKLCPHCGQPAKTEIDCRRCDTHAVICDECIELPGAKDTCSKHCAYQFKLHPARKGPPQDVPFEKQAPK